MKKVLTIAGSDCSGGAGIQADIKTMTAHKVYAMSVITALTAQNTTGVYGVLDAGADFVGQQMDCVFKDIFPDAVKIGMVSNIETIQVIAAKLKEYNAKNIVVDPVMVSHKRMCANAAGCYGYVDFCSASMGISLHRIFRKRRSSAVLKLRM